MFAYVYVYLKCNGISGNVSIATGVINIHECHFIRTFFVITNGGIIIITKVIQEVSIGCQNKFMNIKYS